MQLNFNFWGCQDPEDHSLLASSNIITFGDFLILFLKMYLVK